MTHGLLSLEKTTPPGEEGQRSNARLWVMVIFVGSLATGDLRWRRQRQRGWRQTWTSELEAEVGVDDANVRDVWQVRGREIVGGYLWIFNFLF